MGNFEGVCPKFQEALNNAFQNTAQKYRKPVGMMDAINSPENRAGVRPIQTIMSNQNGGVRQVGFTYITPKGESDVVTARPDVCNGTDTQLQKEMLININELEERFIVSQTLSRSDLLDICNLSNTQYLTEMVMNVINAVNSAIDSRFLAQVNANFGNFYNNGSGANIVELLKADDAPNFGQFSRYVLTPFKAIGGREDPLLIGGDLLYTFADLMKIGCCNDGGLNLGAGNSRVRFYYDQGADLIPGQDQFIGMLPGSVQMIQHNRYGEGSNARFTDARSTMSTILDPWSNMLYDIKIEWNTCNEKWFFTIGTSYKLVFMPTDMYPAGSEMDGVNGILHFLGTAAADTLGS